MPRLIPCPSCHSHVLVSERVCPHCNASQRSTASPALPAVLLGLALTGCPTNDEPAYGVPTTGEEEMATDTASETDTDMGTGDASTDETTEDTAESEYGVASTGDTENPLPPSESELDRPAPTEPVE